MKAVVAAFNQEKALVGAFSVITNLRMVLFEALLAARHVAPHLCGGVHPPGDGPEGQVSMYLLIIHSVTSAKNQAMTVAAPPWLITSAAQIYWADGIINIQRLLSSPSLFPPSTNQYS